MGAGVAGLTTAQRLLLQGSSVTILERGTSGQESSWAGGGILSPLCPWDYPEEVTRLTSLGSSMYPEWVEELHAASGIDPEFAVSGMRVMPPYDLSLARRWCEGHAWVSEEQGNDLYLPEVAQVRNPRLLQALRRHVEMLGGNIVEQCEVQKLLLEDGMVQGIATTSGDFRANQYVVCAGAWSEKLLGPYAMKLDIKPIRGQMLLFKFDIPPLRHILLQEGLYLIPRRDGHLLVGSTLEDVGFDKGTTIAARDSLRQRAELLLPSLREMPLVQHWSGLRPASAGNIPTISRHPFLQNLYINSGHFRYGVTMAPASALILLNDLNGVEQPFDVSSYRTGWGVAREN